MSERPSDDLVAAFAEQLRDMEGVFFMTLVEHAEGFYSFFVHADASNRPDLGGDFQGVPIQLHLSDPPVPAGSSELRYGDQAVAGEAFIDACVDQKGSPFSGGYLEPLDDHWGIVLTVRAGERHVPYVQAPSGMPVQIEHEIVSATRAIMNEGDHEFVVVTPDAAKQCEFVSAAKSWLNDQRTS